MNYLTDCVREDREYAQLLRAIHNLKTARTPLPILVGGLCDGATDAMYVSLLTDLKQKLIAIGQKYNAVEVDFLRTMK